MLALIGINVVIFPTLSDQDCQFYPVAPDKREYEMVAQIKRPAFKSDLDFTIGYLPFNILKQHCDSMRMLAESHAVLKKIARFEF